MSEDQNTEYFPLRNDLMFHLVFTRNNAALKGLLSVLLNIPESSIKRVEVLNPMQYSESDESRLTILDLKLHLNDDTFVLVEIQLRNFPFWTNRALAYASRQVADQITGDFKYDKLEPVIQISIMNYTLFPEHRRFFAKYTPRDEEGYEFTNMLRFYVLDLTQIESATEEQREQGLVEWAKAFRAENWNEVRNIENSGIREAVQTMELIMANPTERELIRMRQVAEYDWNTMIHVAKNAGIEEGKALGIAEGKAEGIAEGIDKGKAEGIAEGKAEGIAEGIDMGKAEIARGMKREGYAPDVIARLCKLTQEEINAL